MAEKKPSIETEVFGFSSSVDTINSKQKGNTNERVAAKALKSWTGYSFVRVPSSGGLRWRDSGRVSADLICDEPDVEFDFTIETKHLKKITIARVLKSNSMIFTIWEQVMSDALRCQKIPMAMLRANGMPAGEYYLILDAGMGGMLMSLSVPTLFSGANSKYTLVGFKFSEVKKYLKWPKFEAAVKKSNLVAKSKFYVS